VRSIAAATSLFRKSWRGFPPAGLLCATLMVAARHAQSSARQPFLEIELFTASFYQRFVPAFGSVSAAMWDAQRPRLGKRSQQCRNSSVVAKRLADVCEPVYISRPKHEASAQLKRILPQLVLMMAAGTRALSRHGVFTAQEMQ
jgi:hypothetical protein